MYVIGMLHVLFLSKNAFESFSLPGLSRLVRGTSSLVELIESSGFTSHIYHPI